MPQAMDNSCCRDRTLPGWSAKTFSRGELPGRQAHGSSADRRLAPQQVDAEAADAQHAGRDGGPGPEPGPHTGQEFLETERLPQVVVRAKIEPFDPVVHASPGTEHEDRNRGSPLPQARKHIKAIQAGQAEIQYHERDAGVHETPERENSHEVLRPFSARAALSAQAVLVLIPEPLQLS
jgi:hypothetical protein